MRTLLVVGLVAGMGAVACAPATSHHSASNKVSVEMPPGSANPEAAPEPDGPLPARTNVGEHRDCTGTLTFDDKNLEAAVRLEISKLGGEILAEDVTKLNQLSVAASDVEKLGGIECLTKLRLLNVGGAKVSDLTPLAELTELEYLYLDSTEVRDLTPIAGLTKLYLLDLGSTQVRDLTPIAGLTKLRILYLRSTQVRDLTPLAGLAELLRLYLDSTQVRDLTPIAGLTKLRLLYLRPASIDCAEQAASIQALKSRGCLVLSDCP